MTATFHDSALANDGGPVSTLPTADTLAVTAGDKVAVHVKCETPAATGTVDTGASTPTFDTGNAKYTHADGGFWSQTFHWTATSTGNVTPRVVFSGNVDFATIRAISYTPAAGTTLNAGATAVGEGESTTPSSGSASATAAGAAFAGFGMFGSVTYTEGSGWTEPAEFEGSVAAHAAYQLQTGAGSLTANGTIGTQDWIAQLLIFDEAPFATLVQEGFRWGVDDGNEASHGWEAAQDTDITIAANQSRLIRLLVDSTSGDQPATAWTLRFQKNGSGGYVDVPVGATATTSPPAAPSATVTTVGAAADPWTINRPAANTGDVVVFVIGWDDSTNVTSVTPPAGPNGETAQSIAGPIASSGTEIRLQAWYYVATGAWSTGTLSFDPSAAETCRAVAFVIPAGEFKASDVIGFANTLASAGTAESNVNSPTGTAEGDDGSGRLYIAFCSDADALTVPGSNWNTINNATGGGVGLLVGSRNTLVSNSESIAALTATITSDSWASLAFVVKPNVVNNEVYVTTSANITAGGEATTARLTAPSGKTTSDFTTGRRWDDENGTDTIDVAADFYTELEWLAFFASTLVDGDFIDLRLYAGTVALSTYSFTPRANIGEAGGGDTELVVADALHAHTADNLALIEQEVITVADALHGHTADTIGLLQQNLLVVADATHGHTADNLTLDVALTLVVADATHGHLADQLALIQQNLLAVADAAHGHTADSLTLDTGVVLAVADALHAHGVDNVALTQAAILAIADALHAHAADTIGLQQAHLLVVQDATHAHSVDTPTLTLAQLLAVADSVHVHTADTIALTQASVLIVSDALHAHLADLIGLQLPGLVPPPGRIFDAKGKRTVFVVEGEKTTFVVARGTRTFNA